MPLLRFRFVQVLRKSLDGNLRLSLVAAEIGFGIGALMMC